MDNKSQQELLKIISRNLKATEHAVAKNKIVG